MNSDGQRVQTLKKLLTKGLDCKEKSDLLLGDLGGAMTMASQPLLLMDYKRFWILIQNVGMRYQSLFC